MVIARCAELVSGEAHPASVIYRVRITEISGVVPPALAVLSCESSAGDITHAALSTSGVLLAQHNQQHP
jgi:hypothetical protein